MQHLDSAKAAIEAELNHTRQGLAFYYARIESLENALAQLADITSTSADVPSAKGGKRAAKIVVENKVGKTVKAAKKAKTGKEDSNGQKLPFTGGDFWINLVTSEPKSASEILSEATSSLGFTPTKLQAQKLAGRMAFAINALVKTKSIQDSGKGRERRFFRA